MAWEQAAMTETTAQPAKAPMDVSVALALGVGLMIVVALIIGVFTKDHALVEDLAKNFVGPAFLLIVGYYFGSSKSSAAKDATIADMAK